jgi:hypothetical protein
MVIYHCESQLLGQRGECSGLFALVGGKTEGNNIHPNNALQIHYFSNRKNKLTDPEEWYKPEIPDMVRLWGFTLLEKYYGSLRRLMTSLFPEYDWHPWRFDSVPQGFWDNLENQRRLEWIILFVWQK